MSENNHNNKITFESIGSQEEAHKLIGRLFDVTKPEAVYSQPVTSGDYTVITASEVAVAMGAGFGGGGGTAGSEEGPADGFGGGGGGGGSALSRPVAAISIGPNGVHVEPIVDPTKIAIAFFTTLGAIFMAGARIRKAMNK